MEKHWTAKKSEKKKDVKKETHKEEEELLYKSPGGNQVDGLPLVASALGAFQNFAKFSQF